MHFSRIGIWNTSSGLSLCGTGVPRSAARRGFANGLATACLCRTFAFMQLFGRVALLLLCLISPLFAQAEGEVESFGFGGYYRPDCWVPLLVRLHPTTDAPVSLQLRVYQKDLDNDRVASVRSISLTPAVEGRASDQWFWMYFRPQPNAPKGLPDASAGDTLKDLTAQLKVVLCDDRGQAITNLRLTQMARRADVDAGGDGRVVNSRIVLCVSETAHQPTWREYENATGLTEKPIFLVARLKDLPEDVRGYEMIDSIIWLNAAAPDPRKATEEPRFRALEQFVRQGHTLVVCQGSETSLTRGFETILPVNEISGRDDANLEPLTRTMRLNVQPNATTYACAFARAKSTARVELEKVWPAADGAEQRTPYLARQALGLGCVTWVAQDLSESSLARRLPLGWIYIWDKALGWRNDPQLTPRTDGRSILAVQPYGNVDDTDRVAPVGKAVLRSGSMRLKVSGYVLAAVGFFGIYWVVAGPGASAFLTVRKRAHLNWFAFGAMAVGAAVLSLVLIRLVQSRDIDLGHITLVKVAPDMPAVVESRIGLYIPRDGDKRIELKETEARTTNWITPYPIHPALGGNAGEFLASQGYEVPIEDAASSNGAAITVPYRSTEKFLEARWCGSPGRAGRIDGNVTFAGGNDPELYGVLTNNTGRDLREIYFVFNGPSPYGGDADRVLYVPKWAKDKTLELARVFDRASAKVIGRDGDAFAEPGQDRAVTGMIEPIHIARQSLRGREGWLNYWYSISGAESAVSGGGGINDAGDLYRFTLPFLSLNERIPPMRNQLDNNGRFSRSRYDFARLNGRSFDASSAVAAGQLLILAQAEGPLPYPLEVEGERIGGKGVVFYEIVLPLQRK